MKSKRLHSYNKFLIYSLFVLYGIVFFDFFNANYLISVKIFAVLIVINLALVVLTNKYKYKEDIPYYKKELFNSMLIVFFIMFISNSNFPIMFKIFGGFVLLKAVYYILKKYSDPKNYFAILVGITIIVIGVDLSITLSILTLVILLVLLIISVFYMFNSKKASTE